jgi:hypothetical protein
MIDKKWITWRKEDYFIKTFQLRINALLYLYFAIYIMGCNCVKDNKKSEKSPPQEMVIV